MNELWCSGLSYALEKRGSSVRISRDPRNKERLEVAIRAAAQHTERSRTSTLCRERSVNVNTFCVNINTPELTSTPVNVNWC